MFYEKRMGKSGIFPAKMDKKIRGCEGDYAVREKTGARSTGRQNERLEFLVSNFRYRSLGIRRFPLPETRIPEAD